MLFLPSNMLNRIRLLFTRGLGIRPRDTGPLVEFRVANGLLTIRTGNDQAAMRFQTETELRIEKSFTISFGLLRELCKASTKSIQFDFERASHIDAVEVRYQSAGESVVQAVKSELNDYQFPLPPPSWTGNPGELLTAIQQAMASTTKESSRYALELIQLDGASGRVTGTDGHQLFTQTGFDFPFNEALLVRSNRFVDAKEFESTQQVRVGVDDSRAWLSLQTGDWTVHLPVDPISRFPKIEPLIQRTGHECTTLILTEEDSERLRNGLGDLPAAKEAYSPVTVDMNGQVIIRARGEDEQRVTELRLGSSVSRGIASCFETNRKYLQRASEMGFREIESSLQDSRVSCRDGNRLYLWMTLGAGATSANASNPSNSAPATERSPISPEIPEVSQTEAATCPLSSNNLSPQPQETSMTTSSHSGNGRVSSSASEGNTSEQAQENVIEQAERVRDSLTVSLSDVRSLISLLKKQKKQNRLVRSTLASLRELEPV